MTSEELAAAVLADPVALWIVKTTRGRVAGPWVEAKSEKRRVSVGGDAEWRMTPHGHELAIVHKWWRTSEDEKPNVRDYDFDDEDEDYLAALAAYQERVERRAGREWIWRMDGGRTEYASTKEEAKARADEALVAKGYLLLDELTDSQLRRYRA